RADIEHSLSRRDFVLVISGDAIHENVERIVRSFARKAEHDPLMIADLCLVSWAIFKDAETDQRILVPNLVGVVTEAERQVTIRVNVDVVKGDAQTKVTAEEKEATKHARVTEDEFFRSRWLPAFGKKAVEQWQAISKALTSAGIRGIQT